VTTRTDAPANGSAIMALVGSDVYKTSDQCWYHKGQVEGALLAKFPQYSYRVWCADVPGLVTVQ
jgi:hypothetical protein